MAVAALMMTSAGAEELRGVQVWLGQNVSVGLRPDWEFQMKSEERLSSEKQLLRHVENHPRVVWNPEGPHEVFLGYKRIDSWSQQGDDSSENLAVIGHEMTFPFAEHWKVGSRQMFEAGVAEEESTGQFRHRVRISYENSRALWGFTVALGNEWFYDFDTNRLSQNRLQLGFSREINKTLRWEVFAMRRDDWLPGDVHLLTPITGVSCHLSF
ncbi:MAG: DUF2490 domain-containing protein [Candidatus Methylacidiphilales bacterium]|nr:DUF2490 domain-containing protein [Candidatus Methylacidiphilales bacterium]